MKEIIVIQKGLGDSFLKKGKTTETVNCDSLHMRKFRTIESAKKHLDKLDDDQFSIRKLEVH